MSFAILRSIVFGFLSLLLLYSGVVLIWIYVFKFDSVFYAWNGATGLRSDSDWNLDMGMQEHRRNDWDTLIWQLLTPLACLAVTAVQCKFVHKLWRATTDPANAQPPRTGTDTIAPSMPISRRSGSVLNTSDQSGWMGSLVRCYNRSTDFLWRFAEIHVSKLVAFSLVMLAVYEVSDRAGSVDKSTFSLSLSLLSLGVSSEFRIDSDRGSDAFGAHRARFPLLPLLRLDLADHPCQDDVPTENCPDGA